MNTSKNIKKEQKILAQLDEYAKKYKFPMLDNYYLHPIDSRLHVYYKGEFWGIIIETIDYDYKAQMITCTLHNYGNCVKSGPGIKAVGLLDLSDIMNQENNILIDPEVKSVQVKGETLNVGITKKDLQDSNIDPKFDEGIAIFELFRYLTKDYKDVFFSSEEELKKQFSEEVDKKLQLEEWYHPDVAREVFPSDNETFKMIAKVISHKNPDLYEATKEPNTHWKNWPAAGEGIEDYL